MTDSETLEVLDALAATRCPLCGGPNERGMVSSVAHCWCFNVEVRPEVMDSVPLMRYSLRSPRSLKSRPGTLAARKSGFVLGPLCLLVWFVFAPNPALPCTSPTACCPVRRSTPGRRIRRSRQAQVAKCWARCAYNCKCGAESSSRPARPRIWKGRTAAASVLALASAQRSRVWAVRKYVALSWCAFSSARVGDLRNGRRLRTRELGCSDDDSSDATTAVNRLPRVQLI